MKTYIAKLRAEWDGLFIDFSLEEEGIEYLIDCHTVTLEGEQWDALKSGIESSCDYWPEDRETILNQQECDGEYRFGTWDWNNN